MTGTGSRFDGKWPYAWRIKNFSSSAWIVSGLAKGEHAERLSETLGVG